MSCYSDFLREFLPFCSRRASLLSSSTTSDVSTAVQRTCAEVVVEVAVAREDQMTTVQDMTAVTLHMLRDLQVYIT